MNVPSWDFCPARLPSTKHCILLDTHLLGEHQCVTLYVSHCHRGPIRFYLMPMVGVMYVYREFCQKTQWDGERFIFNSLQDSINALLFFADLYKIDHPKLLRKRIKNRFREDDNDGWRLFVNVRTIYRFSRISIRKREIWCLWTNSFWSNDNGRSTAITVNFIISEIAEESWLSWSHR